MLNTIFFRAVYLFLAVGFQAWVTTPAGAGGAQFILAQAKSSGGKVELDLLRKGAREALDGYAQFDVRGAKSGELVRTEKQVSAACKDLPAVSDAVRRQASALKFEQVGTGRRFPRHTLLYARERPIAAANKSINALDSVAVYFDVSRSGSSCVYTLGADARLLIPPEPLAGLASNVVATLISNETKNLKTAIETIIVGAAGWASSRPIQLPDSGFVAQMAIEYLDQAGTSDQTLNDLRKSLELVIAAHVRRIAGLEKGVALRFVQYTDSPPLIVRNRFYTTTCMAAPLNLERPTIICNARFLYELEFVARTFGDGGIISDEDSRTDAGLFQISARMNDAPGYIRTLREEQKVAPEGVPEIANDRFLSLALFIIGHELGHLAAHHSVYHFDKTPDNLIESQAIVNLCRQADHFRAHYFRLAGLDQIAEKQSELRSWAEQIRKTVEGADIADAAFLAEALADEYGTGVFLDFLGSTYQKSHKDGRRLQAAAVFAIADYALLEWYRRLQAFVGPQCGTVSNLNQISLCLAFAGSDSYIKAFEMYGEKHSAVVTRAAHFLAAVVGERTTFYDIPIKQRIVIPPDQLLRPLSPEKIRDILNVSHQLVYHFVMREFLDAPGKIAYLGCASGYRHQTGKGPKMIQMRFYPLEDEIARVFKRITGQ